MRRHLPFLPLSKNSLFFMIFSFHLCEKPIGDERKLTFVCAKPSQFTYGICGCRQGKYYTSGRCGFATHQSRVCSNKSDVQYKRDSRKKSSLKRKLMSLCKRSKIAQSKFMALNLIIVGRDSIGVLCCSGAKSFIAEWKKWFNDIRWRTNWTSRELQGWCGWEKHASTTMFLFFSLYSYT